MIKKVVVLALIFVSFFNLSCSQKKSEAAKKSSEIKIGLSIDTVIIERWKRDLEVFVTTAEKNGAQVLVQNASNQVEEQISQIEYLISQGVDVLVIVPKKSDSLTQVIQKAKTKNIPVISYDRLILNADVDLYISVNSQKVGSLLAENMKSIVPKGSYFCIYGSEDDYNMNLLDRGIREVLTNPEISIDFRYYTPDWNYDLAYKKMNSLLDSGLIPDAVICGNDAVAESIIRSISEHMVEKAIPVSGQDAEISACRRVVKGTQTATVYKPIDDLAKKASEFAVLLGSKKTIPEDLSEQTVFNGSKDVPVYWLEPALVTSSNINEVIIEPGFHTKKEIYR